VIKQHLVLIISVMAVIAALYHPFASSQIDNGNQQVQDEKAPADARDPHAYAYGYTLTAGPYAQSGSRRLKLADESAFRAILGDRVEYSNDSDNVVYDLQGWYGSTYDRFVAKAEGDIPNGRFLESQTHLLWGQATSPYFDTQIGARFDQYDDGQNRQWLAFGLQGLAPYWFELDITAYLGQGGRTAVSMESEYDLLLTQKLILQPRVEMTWNGKSDSANDLGSGLSDLSIGLRLHYELSRQLAQYMGVEWSDNYGDTADYVKMEGGETSDIRLVAGTRFWF